MSKLIKDAIVIFCMMAIPAMGCIILLGLWVRS